MFLLNQNITFYYYLQFLYVCVCVGEWYCEYLVNYADFLIYSMCNFSIPGTSIAEMREREKHWRLNTDQLYTLVV